MKKYTIAFLIITIIFFKLQGQELKRLTVIGADISITKASIIDSLKNNLALKQNDFRISKISESLYYIEADIAPEKILWVKDIDLQMEISFKSDAEIQEAKNNFHWLPNLKATNDGIVAQHVFRSPCIIQCMNSKSIALIPDIELLAKNAIAPYYLDMNYAERSIKMHYGISGYKLKGHTYYVKNEKQFSFDHPLKMGFYVMVFDGNSPTAFLEKINQFLWNKWATKYLHSTLPQTLSFKQYADTGYTMALRDYWVNTGRDKGGITLSTFYDDSTKRNIGRDSKNDLWFHSWFNNIRTACGLYYWGKKLVKKEWQQKALSCVNLLLDAPKDNGWFPTVYNTQQNKWVASGQGGNENLYHIPDNVWSAYWLLRFERDAEAVNGIDKMSTNLGDAILKIQQPNGSFPERINVSDHHADSMLQSTGSSGISTWFLEELLLRKKIKPELISDYKKAIIHSLEFLSKEVLPRQKFEDFEVYFSCAAKPFMPYYDSSSALYAQNTLSIQWCAEAYLKGWQLFKEKKYLDQGEYCLNILSLYQQIWNPPFINFYAFGGFGAQNSDAEWSDARQAQFAETYLSFYFATNKKEYLERGIAACRASFTLMAIPENKKVSPLTYEGKPDGEVPISGNMPENYGHSGYDVPSGQSGFHWGTGSALETAAVSEQRLWSKHAGGKNKNLSSVLKNKKKDARQHPF